MEDDTSDLAGRDGVSVHSGFPNPAAERTGQDGLALDLNRLVVRHPGSTYLFRVSGHRWTDQGLFDGDIAVIDRGVERHAGDLVVSWQNDSFAIRVRNQLTDPEAIWGVVVAVIHQYR